MMIEPIGESGVDHIDYTLAMDLDAVLVSATTMSKAEARRLRRNGAVEINGDKVGRRYVLLDDGDVVRVGKRQWFRLEGLDWAKEEWLRQRLTRS